MKSAVLYLATGTLFLISFVSCHKSGTTGGGGGTDIVTIGVAGRVLDENKLPLSGVQIEAGTVKTMTDVNGKFTLNSAQFKNDAAFVKLTKTGYFTGFRTFTPTENATNNVEVTLIKKNVVGNFNSANGGQVSVSSGGSINFPASGLVNASSNAAYSGTVEVAAFFINPTSPDFRTLLPGDLRGINAAGKQVGLESFGMMAVELNGAGGEKLQLAAGKQATITFPIPASLISKAPVSIPLWSFDESTGQWKEEGAATKQGSNYVGTVNHFSFWNCDLSIPAITFTAIIQDKQNQILPGVAVHIRRPNGSTGYGITDANGKVGGLIPSNENLKMIVFSGCASDSVNIGPFTSNQDLGVIHVNGNNPTIAVVFSGTAVNCSGGPVTNGYVNILIEGANHRAAINNGSFTYTLNRCNSISVSAQLIATDIDANKQSTPTNFTVTSGNVNAGQLNTCITLTNYINFTVNGVAYTMTPPSDSLTATVQFIMQTRILGQNIGGTLRYYDLGTLASGTGTTVIDGLTILVGNNYYFKRDTVRINLTFTEFGGSGQYLAGTFSGTLRDSINRTNVPVTSNFRVRRY